MNNKVEFETITLEKHSDKIDVVDGNKIDGNNYRNNVVNLSDEQIEIICNIVKSKINTSNSIKNFNVIKYIKLLSQILGIFLLISLLYFGYNNLYEDNIKFTYTDGDLYSYHNLISNKNDMNDTIDRIININNWIKNLSKNKILEMVEPSDFATLLYGSPGTGKTIFVESLCYKLDLILKNNYLLEIKNELFINKLKSTNEYNNYIKNMDSMVEYYYITPSLINDKYVGGSEKNINDLFEYLYNTNNTNKIRIVLFDEAESFFNKRSEKDSNGQAKCEFLTKISQIPKEFKNVYLFAATNCVNQLDTAFLRRFGNKIHSELPSFIERKLIIESVLKKCNLSLNQIDRIANKTNGRSQAFIKRTCKKYIIYDNYGNIIKYNLDKYIEFLNNMSEHELY